MNGPAPGGDKCVTIEGEKVGARVDLWLHIPEDIRCNNRALSRSADALYEEKVSFPVRPFSMLSHLSFPTQETETQT